MAQLSREEYERLSPYKAWIHRMQFGEPAGGTPVKFDTSGNTFVKNTVPALAESAAGVFPGIARKLGGGGDPQVTKLSLAELLGEGAASGGASPKRPEQEWTPRVPPKVEPATSFAGAMGGSERADTLQQKRKRLEPYNAVGVNGPQNVAKNAKNEFASLMAGVDPSSITAPEEKAYDNKTSILKDMIQGGSKAIEARRSYIPDATREKNKTASRLRNKRTGQVDPLAFGGGLGGGRGNMMIALAGQQPAEDLSTPEGRRAAFGEAPSTDPAKAGPVLGDGSGKTQLTADQLRGIAPGSSKGGPLDANGMTQRQRILKRKQDVAAHRDQILGAGARATAMAATGSDIEDVLAGLPPTAKRAARRAFMQEQQRQLAVAAEEKLSKAKQEEKTGADQKKIGYLIALIESDPTGQAPTTGWARQELQRMLGGATGPGTGVTLGALQGVQ